MNHDAGEALEIPSWVVGLRSITRDDHLFHGTWHTHDDIREKLREAGLDNDEIGGGSVTGHLHAVGHERADELVGVDVVLWTAERFDVEALHKSTLSLPHVTKPRLEFQQPRTADPEIQPMDRPDRLTRTRSNARTGSAQCTPDITARAE